MAGIDWEEINSKLPYHRNDEEKEQRKALFKQFDPNDNGYLSLAEVSFWAKINDVMKGGMMRNMTKEQGVEKWLLTSYVTLLGQI